MYILETSINEAPTQMKTRWLNLLYTLKIYSSSYLLFRQSFIYKAYSSDRLPWWFSGKEYTCQCRRCSSEPWVRKIPWRRKCQPTPVFLAGKSHGQRRLAGYSPRVYKRVGRDSVTKQQQQTSDKTRYSVSLHRVQLLYGQIVFPKLPKMWVWDKNKYIKVHNRSKMFIYNKRQ